VNGLLELRVLREFASHDYRRHPKYNQCVVLHLFDASLPRSVYEKCTDGAGRDALCFTRMEKVLTEHKLSLERLESAVGSIRVHLNIPSPAARNRKRGGKGAADGVEELE
jgi:hypothetical protein